MSGAASNNAKQTNIKFTRVPKEQEPHAAAASSNTNNERRVQKRGRFEIEPVAEPPNGAHLRVPPPITPSSSDSSLFDRDSIGTIIDVERQEDPIPNATPRETNEFTNIDEEDMQPRLIRLDRLKDKADRYSSHISFLKECKESKVIPRGLKIDLEPSIGNNDEAFCTLWFKRCLAT